MSAMRLSVVHDYAVVLARLLLGVVFLMAALDKIADPAAFAGSIDNYRIFSHQTALIIATVLPWLELVCSLALLLGIAVRGSSLLIFLMLGVFTIAVISALLRSLDISCGCFTQDPSASKIGWGKVGENITMIALSAFLMFTSSRKLSLEWLIRPGNKSMQL